MEVLYKLATHSVQQAGHTLAGNCHSLLLQVNVVPLNA
jgi:hypothetical protein